MHPWKILVLLVCGAVCGCGTPAAVSEPVNEAPLRVMSFNVRYGSAKDGPNHWDLRRDLCVSRISAFDPDLLGLQEALHFQNAYIREKHAGLEQLGVAREDGKEKGEYTTLMYRASRLKPLESGTFWLSETPEVPGSKSWDSSLPRIATWAVFSDKQNAGRRFLAVNTHFDHRGPQARIESAWIIRAFAAKKAAGLPVVITGDFNAAPGSEPHRVFFNPGEDGLKLLDTYAEIFRENPEPEQGTAHAFQVKPVTARIDWVLCSPHFSVVSAGIDRTREGTLFPSDHYPVTAVFKWRAAGDPAMVKSPR